jgi:predicted nucleotide-binding protein
MSSETSSVLVPYAVNSFCTMDKTIRKNEICIIGLPRCDFVFSSTRSCFIAYGFRDSTLEMTILRHLLEQKGIVPVEAGGSLAPGQHAFCAKICSKIITSQFCIVLINNEETERGEIPNANVNMEYGLMLGFNKYIIPFQRASQTLPFNIAGLDTIKYNNQDFERLASTAIEQAIQETRQDAPQTLPVDQGIWNFPAC